MNPSILVVTPIAPGTILAPCNISYPRLVSELAPSVSIRESNININRARLQEIFKRCYFSKYKFVCLLDSDVVANDSMINALLDNWKEHSTPCIRTKPVETVHTIAAFSLIHRNDYMNVKYIEEEIGKCQCLKVPNPFYIDGISTYEIKNK